MIGPFLALTKPKLRVSKFSVYASKWKPLDVDDVHGLAAKQGELLEEILKHAGDAGRRGDGHLNTNMLKLANEIRDMILDSTVAK